MKKKAFTLAEALVVVTILLLVGFLVMSCGRNFTGANSSHAESELRSWISSQYPSPRFEITATTCNQWDSDGDGYVSCSTTVTDTKTDMVERIPVECAAWMNGGCREQRIGGRNYR